MEKINLAILGGGPVGITAALEAAIHGANVTLISAEPPGGRATWHSLLPSKVYLTAADSICRKGKLTARGLSATTAPADLLTLREQIAQQKHSWSEKQTALLKSNDIHLISGKASFTDLHTLNIETEEGHITHAFDKAIIATGSVPIFFPDLKPDGNRLLAPRFASQFTEWPEKIIVVGGGVTSAEFVYLFNTMGSKVEWVTDLPTFLPRSDEDISEALETSFLERGVILHHSSPARSAIAENNEVIVKLQDGVILNGTHAFIAIGRRGDIANLNLEHIQVQAGRLGILTDDFGQTSQPHIYAAGDAAGPPFVVNRGLAQARIASRHALEVPTLPYASGILVEAIYTFPQVAQVGLTEKAATEAGIPVNVTRMNFASSLKASLEETDKGFIKLVSHPSSAKILGAAAIGDHAADILAPVAVAIKAGLPLSSFSEIFPAYPTLSELPFITSRGY